VKLSTARSVLWQPATTANYNCYRQCGLSAVVGKQINKITKACIEAADCNMLVICVNAIICTEIETRKPLPTDITRHARTYQDLIWYHWYSMS